jgi:hypothetical protein
LRIGDNCRVVRPFRPISSSLADIQLSMSLDAIGEHSPRARPVGDAPVAALLDGVEELARRWAIALILKRPLAEMPQVPLDALARAAPSLCAQIVRALDSDAELQRLGASDEPRARGGVAAMPLLAALSSADARTAIEAIEALRGVLWEAILGELRDPPARQVADLSDRLAFVCATVLAEALGEARARSAEASPGASAPPVREHILYASAQPSPARRGAVLVDEHQDAPSLAPSANGGGPAHRTPVAPPARAAAPERPMTPAEHSLPGRHAEPSRTTARPLPWDMPLRAELAERRPPEGVNGDAATSRRALYDEDPVMRVTRGPGAPLDERR